MYCAYMWTYLWLYLQLFHLAAAHCDHKRVELLRELTTGTRWVSSQGYFKLFLKNADKHNFISLLEDENKKK